MKLTPGIHLNVPMADYLAIDAVSNHALRDIEVSARHYRHRKRFAQTETAEMALGRATHTAVLEPVQFLRDYVLWPAINPENGKKAVRNGKRWDNFQAANAGREILKESDYHQCRRLNDACRENDTARDLITRPGGDSEVTLIWRHASGALCKARIDRLIRERSGYTIVELKTAKDASPKWFPRDAAGRGYHKQVAWYDEGLDAVLERPGGILPSISVRIIAIQNNGCLDTVVYEVTDDVLAVGADANETALKKLIECREEDYWPGACPTSTYLELPKWAIPEHLREDGDAGCSFDLTGIERIDNG
jgi:hypothetical protein